MPGMLRITGGLLGGRRLKVPPGGGVRPTQDRVREALFSSLQEQLEGASFLDLFAGSGSVGLEAWSRGAARVCWVESDRRVYSVLKGNVAALCGSAAVECRLQDVFSFCRGWRGAPGFDMIFADPPYASHAVEAGLAGRLLAAVGTAGLAVVGGILVIEQGAREPTAVEAGWVAVRERGYGRSCLRVYRREEEGRQ